jgi:uncharacterized RDD family membrane protein YckC
VISAIAGVTISEVIGDGGLSVASALVAAALWATASLIYLYFFWGLAGQTPGMRFLGIRIEAAGDPHLGRRRARRRLGGLLLALLPLGLGLLWILVSDDRRVGTIGSPAPRSSESIPGHHRGRIRIRAERGA